MSGFRAVHIPGHAPGMIALYRERDGLALTSDCFYTLDPQTGIHGPPRLPHPAFNLDTEQARASIRKLAELKPSSAWPGHAEPLTRRRRRPARARGRGDLMGKRSRRRGAQDALAAPESEYRSPAGDVLVLRGAMSPATRREYAATAAGSPLSREDAWQRAAEFLFERLARALGDRRHRADHAPEGAARPLSLRHAGRAPVDPRGAARAPRRALPRARAP